MTLMGFGRMRKTVLWLCASAGMFLAFWPAWRLDPQQAPEPHPGLHAKPWTEAEGLFRRDPRWLGGDVAYSVDLSRERVLWLFGDSFIGTNAAGKRTQSTMVRNSVAIETGYDPSRASLKFYWRMQKGRPASFVPETRHAWLWPTHGVRLGTKLLLFFTRVRPDNRKDSLGFENFGWAAYLVDNPDQEPSAWVLRKTEIPTNAWNVIVGAAALVAGDFLYVFGPAEPSHDVYLLRWPLGAAEKGDLASPEWWCGLDQGWTRQQKLVRRPTPVFSEGGMEFSVQWDPHRKKFLAVHSVGFGASEIAIRWAERLQGPWSGPTPVYRPPESARPHTLEYAAKAHAELSGDSLVDLCAARARRLTRGKRRKAARQKKQKGSDVREGASERRFQSIGHEREPGLAVSQPEDERTEDNSVDLVKCWVYNASNAVGGEPARCSQNPEVNACLSSQFTIAARTSTSQMAIKKVN